MIKVLMIAPLPKDQGGSYTSGICKVAYELTLQEYDDITMFLSSTNISEKNARKLCDYNNQYNGYEFHVVEIIMELIRNPYALLKEMYSYYRYCHQNPFKFLFYRVNIQRHIASTNPDIIHVHTTEAVPAYFANRGRVPMLMTMHGVFYRGDRSQYKLRDWLSEGVKHCDYFTGLSEECKNLMLKYFQINDKDITIIPNGVNTKRYYFNSKERHLLRLQYGVNDCYLFITVASIQDRKGQFKFLKILETLNINWNYWILGEGPDKLTIERYCTENGLENKVRFFGHIKSDELYKYYSAADVYAHTSTMEGQSLSELEAYATGLRIVINEQIKDTVATDTEDSSVYYKINMKSADATDFTKWIVSCQKKRVSRTNVDWSNVAKEYENVYKMIKNKKI